MDCGNAGNACGGGGAMWNFQEEAWVRPGPGGGGGGKGRNTWGMGDNCT